jgi:2-polyprenyl-6-methoxyphenol hydroxylase-like FAD-dependent oxidoreductase
VFSFFIQKTMSRLAVFENGETEYGDIFIGADGSNSKVRESLLEKSILLQ